VTCNQGGPPCATRLPSRLLSFYSPVVLLASLVLPIAAIAEEPMLAIRQGDGESAVYAVSEIDQVVFEGDSLFVLRAGGGQLRADLHHADRLPLGLLRRDGSTDAAGLIKAMRLFQNKPNPFTLSRGSASTLPRPVEWSWDLQRGRAADPDARG